ncbi:MAG: DMT family transporter [Elusimicrobia bacterium]|nr:DMT family transporter [Elusimicrobiota bacterium]
MSPLACLFASWAVTAVWPITAKLASRYADPLAFGPAALVLGLAALSPWLLTRGRWRRLVEPGLRRNFLVVGGLGSGLTTLMLLIAVSHTTAANAAIMCQVEVVYSAILSALLLRERITGRQALASSLVFAGTALILSRDLGTPHWKGDLLILATPWMFQVSHVFSKRLPKDLEPVTIAGARMLYGGLVLVPVAVVAGLLGRVRVEPSAVLGGIVVFHGLVLNALTVVLWYGAIRHLELAKTTAIMLSYPALTLLYCWLLGQEPIGWHQVAGLALSLSGALWLTSQVRESRAAAIGAAAAAA